MGEHDSPLLSWPLMSQLMGCPEPGQSRESCLSLQGYGRAQHSISTEKIKARYPDYSVTWADDGY